MNLANICLGEDIFSVTLFCLPRRIEDVFKTSSTRVWKTPSRRRREDVLKMSWRRPLLSMFSRRLEDVLKTFWKVSWTHLKMSYNDVFKMSWRSIENTFWRHLADKSWKRLEHVFEDEKWFHWRHLQEVFKTSWKTRNVCWESET